MRVLSNAPDPRLSGPWRRSLDVAEKLRSRDVETEFLVPAGDDGVVSAATDRGLACRRIEQPRIRHPRKVLDNARFLTGFRRTVSAAAREIEAGDFDVVHANGPLNFPVALAAARSSASLVWHFNDTLTPTPLKQLSAVLSRRWATERVVAARAVHEYFFRANERSTTLYPPVDPVRFDPDRFADAATGVREEFNVPEDRSLVGTVANLNPAKGHIQLVEAFAEVADIRDVHLLIVGKRLDSQKAYHERLKNRVDDLGLEEHVTFVGWRNDVPRLLAAMDVFVLASVTEACPIVVLEAMAMTCAVVATDVGGVGEQLPDDDHGWVVPPREPSRLSAAIDAAVADPERRRRCGKHARSRVQQVFSLERIVDDHLAVYRSALGTSDGE